MFTAEVRVTVSHYWVSSELLRVSPELPMSSIWVSPGNPHVASHTRLCSYNKIQYKFYYPLHGGVVFSGQEGLLSEFSVLLVDITTGWHYNWLHQAQQVLFSNIHRMKELLIAPCMQALAAKGHLEQIKRIDGINLGRQKVGFIS